MPVYAGSLSETNWHPLLCPAKQKGRRGGEKGKVEGGAERDSRQRQGERPMNACREGAGVIEVGGWNAGGKKNPAGSGPRQFLC